MKIKLSEQDEMNAIIHVAGEMTADLEEKIHYRGAYNRIKDALLSCKEKNQQVLKDLGISFQIRYITYGNQDNWRYDLWEATGENGFPLRYRTGLGFREYMGRSGPHHLAFLVPPSSLDILNCIRLEDPQGQPFESWALDQGYDPNSRKAEDIYMLCILQTQRFKACYPEIDVHKYEPLNEY